MLKTLFVFCFCSSKAPIHSRNWVPSYYKGSTIYTSELGKDTKWASSPWAKSCVYIEPEKGKRPESRLGIPLTLTKLATRQLKNSHALSHNPTATFDTIKSPLQTTTRKTIDIANSPPKTHDKTANSTPIISKNGTSSLQGKGNLRFGHSIQPSSTNLVQDQPRYHCWANLQVGQEGCYSIPDWCHLERFSRCFPSQGRHW